MQHDITILENLQRVVLSEIGKLVGSLEQKKKKKWQNFLHERFNNELIKYIRVRISGSM